MRPSSSETPEGEIVKKLSKDIRFRQARLSNEQGLLTVEVAGRSYTVANWSRMGMAFMVPKDKDPNLALGQDIEKITVKLDGRDVYSGAIRVHVEREAKDHVQYGLIFRSNLFMTDGISSGILALTARQESEEFQEQMGKLNPKIFELLVRMRAFLGKWKARCDEMEQSLGNLPLDRRLESEASFLKFGVEAVMASMKDFNKQIGELVDIESIPMDSVYHKLFEAEIYPYFSTADMAARAKNKPRGYAGDFEMMNQIYRNGFEGKDLLGKILHNYITNEDSSDSVNFRRPFFRAYYEELKNSPRKEFSALSIACGPALEVRELIADWPQEQLDRLYVTLFDLDNVALEHAQNSIFETAMPSGKTPKIQFINASVKSFLTQNSKVSGRYDLIYSGGLFDYLDNPTSTALTEKLFDNLNPGGKLIIGNFTKNNTTKAFCHLITHWHLIHKTEKEILAWAAKIPSASIQMKFDPHRINAFLELTRKP